MIDTKKPVLVTGATGYVAGWIVKKLLEEGYTVHAAVRNPDDKQKISHLEKLASETPGSIKFFKTNLLENGSYNDAMKDCELVFHTASPFIAKYKNAQNDLVDPALNGTINVLNSANQTNSVKKVVLTSSVVAMYADNTDIDNCPNQILTEEAWNTSSSLKYQPYSYSKTLAEKEAWSLYENQNRWKLVVINPGLVMGPSLNIKQNTSESINMLKDMGKGKFKFGVPNIGFGVVDVRDLAYIHFNAAIAQNAEGRNIACGHNTSFLDFAKILKPQYGKKYKISDKPLSKGLLKWIGFLANKTLTWTYVSKNVNVAFMADNTKSKNELNANYRPLRSTLEDTFRQLIVEQII